MLNLNILLHQVCNKLGFHHLNTPLLAISTDWQNDYYSDDRIALHKKIGNSRHAVGRSQDNGLYLSPDYVNQSEIDLIHQYCDKYQFKFVLLDTLDKSVALPYA